MTRLRALAAILACWAVLAGALNVAATASAAAIDSRSAAHAPCNACDDCDKAPCPIPMADCLQVHANAGPALPVAAFELTGTRCGTGHWSSACNALNGLSPPPDPIPPRS